MENGVGTTSNNASKYQEIVVQQKQDNEYHASQLVTTPSVQFVKAIALSDDGSLLAPEIN
jgi:hypothetical protein